MQTFTGGLNYVGIAPVVMNSWSSVPGTENNLAVTNATTRSGIVVAPNASAHTKGNWVELIASSANTCYGIWLKCRNTSSNINYLIDIAIGGAGSEVEIISNYFFHNVSNTSSGNIFGMLGFSIAASTRFSARCQCSAAGNAGPTVGIYLINQISNTRKTNTSSTYGADTATTLGTSVVVGAANSVGAWTQISAATASEHRFWTLGILNDNSGAAASNFVEIAWGPNAGELVPIGTFILNAGASSGVAGNVFPPILAAQVPAGVGLWARAANAGANMRVTITAN